MRRRDRVGLARHDRAARTPTGPTRPPSTPRSDCGTRRVRRRRLRAQLDGCAAGWGRSDGRVARGRRATCAPGCRARRRIKRGRRAAALVVGRVATGRLRVLAEVVGSASFTAEFVDRWRAPGETRSKLWEERFGEQHYVAGGADAWPRRSTTRRHADEVTAVAVTGPHARGSASAVEAVGLGDRRRRRPRRVGSATPARPIHSCCRGMAGSGCAGDVLGAHRTGRRRRRRHPSAQAPRSPTAPQVAPQSATRAPSATGSYLAWRGMLAVEPPRRPEPARVSASAAARSTVEVRARGIAATSRHRAHATAPDDTGSKPMASRAPARSSRLRSTASPTRRARRSSSPSSTSTAADACRSSSPTPPSTTCTIGDRVEPTFRKLHQPTASTTTSGRARLVRAGDRPETEH